MRQPGSTRLNCDAHSGAHNERQNTLRCGVRPAPESADPPTRGLTSTSAPDCYNNQVKMSTASIMPTSTPPRASGRRNRPGGRGRRTGRSPPHGQPSRHGARRPTHLRPLPHSIARHIQSTPAVAVLETMDNGKPIRESRDIDVPLVARHFYYQPDGQRGKPNCRTTSRSAVSRSSPELPAADAGLEDRARHCDGQHRRAQPASYTRLTAPFLAQIVAEAGCRWW